MKILLRIRHFLSSNSWRFENIDVWFTTLAVVAVTIFVCHRIQLAFGPSYQRQESLKPQAHEDVPEARFKVSSKVAEYPDNSRSGSVYLIQDRKTGAEFIWVTSGSVTKLN